jgi:hypothetical protein
MNLPDYLIDQEGYEWSKIVADWSWLLPSSFTIWMVNRFGDLFLVPDDGSVQFLDIGAGTISVLAPNKEAFYSLVDKGNNADNWFLISLTDSCVDAGLTLQFGQCYAFKVPPVLGGQYERENIEPGSLVVNHALLAQIHEQVRGLPDGATVDVVVGP